MCPANVASVMARLSEKLTSRGLDERLLEGSWIGGGGLVNFFYGDDKAYFELDSKGKIESSGVCSYGEDSKLLRVVGQISEESGIGFVRYYGKNDFQIHEWDRYAKLKKKVLGKSKRRVVVVRNKSGKRIGLGMRLL